MFIAHRPLPPLASYVEALWYSDGYQPPYHKERVLPNGKFQILIDLTAGPGAVAGVRSQYVVIDTAAIQSVMGVVFRPGGAFGFFDAPADEFYNLVVPLDLVWGSAVSGLRDCLAEAATLTERFRLLEAALQERARKHLELHPAVQCALREFQREPHIRSVFETAREAGLSRRRLSQLFREQVGLTPKLYCRVHRFQQVVQEIASGAPVNWADIAIAGGYSDQAHFSHEFRDFSGLSPGAYLTAERPFLNHIRMD